MIKVVVVDDELDEIKHIEELLNEVIKEEHNICSYTKYSDDLKAEIENVEEHKIYVLDIELGTRISGINIAKLIRDVDYESEIIFMTNHDKMFESVHRTVYEVFDFIEKFHDFDKKFKKDIKEILKRNFDNKLFVYKANNIEFNVYYKNILYVFREKDDRKLIMVTDHNRFIFNMTLKDMAEKLDNRFRQCHRSCIVNRERIEEKNYKDGYFILDSGESVYMLSKKFKKELEDD